MTSQASKTPDISVDVWRASLVISAKQEAEVWQMLSTDERTRAERFYFERDRQRFIAARGLLRVLLGRYTGLEPGQLIFDYGSGGKPALSAAQNERDVRFNLSHSHGIALFAFSCDCELGIDIEQIRPDVEWEQLARQFFSPDEIAALRAYPPQEQQAAFFRYWTCKEAYLKARGEGLGIPLDQFSVVLNKLPVTLKTVNGSPEASQWVLTLLDIGPDYAAALATQSEPDPILIHEWAWQ